MNWNCHCGFSAPTEEELDHHVEYMTSQNEIGRPGFGDDEDHYYV